MLATIFNGKCDWDDADADITYRMCCITMGTSPSFKAATLFDTGANASYVNREDNKEEGSADGWNINE